VDPLRPPPQTGLVIHDLTKLSEFRRVVEEQTSEKKF
jgi:hypothetical protein